MKNVRMAATASWVAAWVVIFSFALAGCSGGGGGGGAAGGTLGGGGGVPGSQGTLSTPVMLTAGSPYSGTVSTGGPSYYEFTGLAGGATYSVTLSNISNSIIPMYFSSNTTANGQSCFFSAVTGTASCIVQASPAGNIFLMISDFSTNPSTYTINAALAVEAGQGLPTAPVPFVLGANYSGSLTAGVSTTTSDTGNSGYYSLTGLIANHKYSIMLTASAGPATLHAYQSSYSAESVTGCGGASCGITAAGTSLLLQVRPSATATFTIAATDLGAVTPFSAQGAVGAEMVLPLDRLDINVGVAPNGTITPNGSVNTTKSYYIISRLVPGQRYYTYLSGLASSLGDDVDLYVYTDAAYTKLACSSTNTGKTQEACMATPTAAGQLWIVADGSKALSSLGSSYFIGAKRDAQAQGTSAAPQIVNSATDLPFRANWSGNSASYYKITGLTPNTTLLVTSQSDHTWSADYGILSTYPATGFGSAATCQTQNNNGNPYQSCTGTTDASGNLYVSYDTGFFPLYPVGGTAYFNVKPVPVSEGTTTAPLAKTMTTPFTGQVAGGTGYSYYAVTGLTANTAYHILATFGTDGQSAALDVYNTFATSNLTTEVPACSISWVYLNNGCTATSDASGRLWLRMGGWTTTNGSNFTLEALPVPVSVGTAALPFNIPAASLPYRTTVAAAGTDYFMVTGLTIGSEYAFSDYDSSGGESIFVFNDAARTSLVCSTFAMPISRRSSTCRGTSTSGTAYIVAGFGAGTAASYFKLNVALVPAWDGTPAAPIAYTTAGTLLAGKVDVGASYYKATLAPNTLYTISLNSVVGEPDLQVFNNATMTGAAACSSIKGQNLTETCRATSDANGNLWITVDGQLGYGGGTFQLKIQ